jgi:Transposase, Mutator family
LTTGEIQAHLAEIYDTEVSRETISKITDQVLPDMVAWQSRPLDRIYPVLLIDAIVVKVRDSQGAESPSTRFIRRTSAHCSTPTTAFPSRPIPIEIKRASRPSRTPQPPRRSGLEFKTAQTAQYSPGAHSRHRAQRERGRERHADQLDPATRFARGWR